MSEPDESDPPECSECGTRNTTIRKRMNLPGTPALCRRCFDQRMDDEEDEG